MLMDTNFDERVILTGRDRNINCYGQTKHNSGHNAFHDYPIENQDKEFIKKEELCSSKPPRKCISKSKRKPVVRKPEVISTSHQDEMIENMQIYRTDQPEDKDVFLPRLTGSSSRASPDNKSQDGNGQQLRLPEIRKVPNNYSRLALNRSITDLLDPEMEILNKIKHGPRKKKKKRHNKISAYQFDGGTDV